MKIDYSIPKAERDRLEQEQRLVEENASLDIGRAFVERKAQGKAAEVRALRAHIQQKVKAEPTEAERAHWMQRTNTMF